MNLFKSTVAAAAIITCCLGNEMPAKAFWVDECKIYREQLADSNAAISGLGAEMDRQLRAQGYGSTTQRDALAMNKAMYASILKHKGCN